MRELPNLPTTLIICEDYERAKWFIRDHLHVIEQRNSHNYIACHPDDLNKQIHFRIIISPNQLYGHDFHDYILHGRISDYMLSAVEAHATKMKHKFNLGLVE